MTNKECDLNEVCDLVMYVINGGADTLEDLRQWFEGLAKCYSEQLSQEGNFIVRAAITVLEQMIYEKACLVCQFCPSQTLGSQMPVGECISEAMTHKQIECRLLSQLERIDAENAYLSGAGK